MMAADPDLKLVEANAAAWLHGEEKNFERAIEEGLDFAFETTLGANTMPRKIEEAAVAGFEVRVWFVGLGSANSTSREFAYG